MKKVLIGLFLIVSLSVLAVNKGKVPMEHDIDYVWYYYELDSKYENLFSKEKKEFKDKWDIYQGKNDYKNYIVLLKKYIEKYPNDAYAYEALGTMYMATNNFKEAEKWAKKTLEKPERKQSDDIEAAKELLNRINSKLKELNKK